MFCVQTNKGHIINITFLKLQDGATERSSEWRVGRQGDAVALRVEESSNLSEITAAFHDVLDRRRLHEEGVPAGLFLHPLNALVVGSVAGEREKSFLVARPLHLLPSGYGRRLVSWRSWVRILAPYTGCRFFTYICWKIVILFEKTKINEKEGENGPFFKKLSMFGQSINVQVLRSCFYLAKFFSFDSIATHMRENVGIFESLKKAAVEPPLTQPYLMMCCLDRSSADSIGETILSTVKNAA